MKKNACFFCGIIMMAAMTSCGDGKQKEVDDVETPQVPKYTVLENETVDLSSFPKDDEGYVTLFDGKSFNGWRGYGKEEVPTKWVIEDGAIKFDASGSKEAQERSGGDLVFAHKFKNFELELEWKVAKGSNSGIFYLAQEVEATDPNTGETKLQPIYISAPEAQVLDNENHPDAKLGKDDNRKSMSLYDMIPAAPQNSKPHGEWNKAKIVVNNGTVVHVQNDADVVEYQLWNQQWTDRLQASKFSEEKWPLAFELLNNVGGPNKEGYIGLQDHGDDVWFRNIRIKEL